MKRIVVIGNPRAGRGVAKTWAELVHALTAAGVDADVQATQAPGHGIELAAAARRGGADLVVAAGGDGTVHEVVNGLLADASASVPVLGVVPIGTGCDYVKTFGIPSDIDAAVAVVASDDPPRVVDAGEITFQGARGVEKRFFANIAEVGVGPEVVERASRLPRRLGAAVYLFGFLLTVPRFTKRRTRASMDGDTFEGDVTDLVVAIGRVFGGGMQITPNADPSDGVFDVQIHTGSKLDYVRAIPKVFKGTHVPHPAIDESRAAEVTVECEPPGLIEADGEVIGHTPATFRVLPGALRLKV